MQQSKFRASEPRGSEEEEDCLNIFLSISSVQTQAGPPGADPF